MMKGRKIISIGLSMLMLASLTGCSLSAGRGGDATTAVPSASTEIPKGIFDRDNGSTEDGTDTTADLVNPDGMTEQEALGIYSDTLDNFCTIMLAGTDAVYDMELTEGAGWLYDIMAGRDSETALASVGYQIKDISGDGIPELLIGSITDQDEYNDYGSYIFSLYTIVDGVPQCTVEGWYRSSYRMMANGQIYYEGSSGAMYSTFGVYDISYDGTELLCQDFYFTSNTDDSYETYAMYHNTTGEWDVDSSEMLDLPEDQFWDVGEEYRQQTYNLTFTTLLDYAKDRNLTAGGLNTGNGSSDQNTSVDYTPAAIHIQWASDYTGRVDDYDYFNLAGYDNEHLILITTDRTVTDFRILSLEFQDVMQDGTMLFDETELYHQEQLTPERPFVVGMDLMGTIPNNGISYVDGNGDYRRFAVTESGEDGSLLLMEY